MAVSALIGSSAGFIGYGDKPRFAKDNNVENRKTKDGRKLQVVLFDVVEKARFAKDNNVGNRKTKDGRKLQVVLFDVVEKATNAQMEGGWNRRQFVRPVPLAKGPERTAPR